MDELSATTNRSVERNTRDGSDASRRLSIGVVGAGNVVFENHLPVLMALEGVDVRWIGDTNPKRVDVVARAYGLQGVALRTDGVDLPAADVVLLAIPYGARAPYYERLQRRAKETALYIEKPVARTEAEHRNILTPYADHQVACGYYRRASALLHEVALVTAEQMFGRLREIYAGIGGLGSHSVGGGYKSDLALAGGGLLFEAGVHVIDSVLFAAKATAAGVEAVKMELDGGFDLHTEAMLRVEVPDSGGASMKLVVSNTSNPVNEIAFHFDHAVIRFNIFAGTDMTVSSRRNAKTAAVFTMVAGRKRPEVTPFQCLGAYWRDFLGGVRGGAANYTSGADSLLTTKVIEALYGGGRK